MLYIKVKDRAETNKYNSIVDGLRNSNYDVFRKWVDDYLKDTYVYCFGRKEKDGFHLTCSICGHETVSKKANNNICKHCGRPMVYKRGRSIENRDWLSFIEETEDYYITRTYYLNQTIDNDCSKRLYFDEIKREFYHKKNGLEFSCSKGMHSFFSTILYQKKYSEWIPAHKYPYDREVGGSSIWSIFCPLLIPEFKGDLQYCSFKDVALNKWSTNFVDHIKAYEENKALELICKTKWENAYWRFKDILKVMDFTNKRLLKKCIKTNANETMIKILKIDPNIDFETLKRLSNSSENFIEIISLIGLKNALKGQEKYPDMYIYKDYLKALFDLNVPFDKSNMFPKDIDEAHDRTIARLKIVENKKYDKEIKKFAKELKFNFKSKKYDVIVPKTSKEIIQEGEQQHNCVGRMGYIERMAERRTIICFLRKKEDINKSFVTIELDPERKHIRQAFTSHNKECPKDARMFIEKKLLARS